MGVSGGLSRRHPLLNKARSSAIQGPGSQIFSTIRTPGVRPHHGKASIFCVATLPSVAIAKIKLIGQFRAATSGCSHGVGRNPGQSIGGETFQCSLRGALRRSHPLT